VITVIMKKQFAPARLSGADSERLGAALCFSLFLAGCFAGAAAAGAIALDSLHGYLSGLSPEVGEGAVSGAAYFPKLLSSCKYHIAAVFFGFSILGVACVPGLAAARGFSLCFTAAAFTRVYGAGGVPLTLAMFAACVTITIPCFFVLSVQSFSSSRALLRSVVRGGGGARAQTPYGPRFFSRCALCVPAIAAAALIDTLLLPKIMLWLARRA
jgi:uncharacterized membrane protein SpoIIM required for sporulation